MSSAIIIDYDSVLAAYESIIQRQCNWLLLKYADNSDDLRLSLHASGSEGLPELKQALSNDLDKVHIAFFREEASQVRANPGFALINFIPVSVSGVRRARALVHSRRVGACFTKTEYATLTVDHPSNLTSFSIHQAFLNPDSPHTIQIGRSISTPPPDTTASSTEMPSRDRQPIVLEPIRRSFTEMYALSSKISSSSSPPKSSSMFSGLLRRKNNPSRVEPLTESEEDVPPPIPPKDKGVYATQSLHQQRQPYSTHTRPQTAGVSSSYTPATRSISQPRPIPQTERRNSLSEFAVISNSFSSDEVVVERPSPESKPISPPQTQSPSQSPKQGGKASLFSVPLDRKWISEVAYIPSPEERARRRALAQEQRQKEEEEALRKEAERQARIKLEKQEMLRREEEEEERRKASLEEELRQIAAERRMREKREKEEEERLKREIEKRKQADRERRLEEHKKLEQWRQAQERAVLESEKRETEERKKTELRRKKKIQDMVQQVKTEIKSEISITAWATLQTSDSLVWRRRYFKLIGSTLFIYRSAKDLNQILEEVELRGRLVGTREWNEGFEELKAIPHSFAIEFKDGREPWALFSDTEDEKFKLLGMLHFAAGL